MFSSLSDIMCVEYYENNRGNIEPLLGGSHRLPESPGLLIHKETESGKEVRKSIPGKGVIGVMEQRHWCCWHQELGGS